MSSPSIPVRSAASVTMSISGTWPQRSRTAFFRRRRLRGSGWASRAVSWIAPLLRSVIRSQSRSGQRVVQRGELGAHLLAQPGGERLGVQGLAQLVVVLGAVDLEVGREVFVGVSPFVRADDPDLLAAQPLAQRLEDARFVDAAHDAGAAAGVGLGQQLGPVGVDGAVQDDVLAERVVRAAVRGRSGRSAARASMTG